MSTTNTNVGLQIYGEKVIEALRRYLAPIFAFSLDLSPAAAKIGDVIRVPKITGDAADDFNASTNNYKATSAALVDIEVKIDKRKLAKFGIDDEQAANFLPAWWERKAIANVSSVAEAALDDILGLVTAENFGDAAADKASVSLSGFSTKGIAAIRAAAIAKKLRPGLSTLVLNPDFYSALLGSLDSASYGGSEAVRSGVIPNLMGFRQVIECPSLTEPGFVCHADAIAVANRWLKPVAPESYSDVGSATDDESGLTVGIREYGDPDTGVKSVSTELCYGREVGNSGALLRLV
jgi:hypothetical protein